MKAVILAGGLGTRISEETSTRPKPMIEIGGHPMLWHIMKIYAAHGITDFVVCLGYKGFVVKEYFLNYRAHNSDLTIALGNGHVTVHQTVSEPWSVTLVDTGDETMTGGRLRRAKPYLDDETFCCTYGDGVADLDVTAAIAQHRASGKAATLAAVRPPGRFGALAVDGRTVTHFVEKPDGDGGWINGGFFVIEPDALDRIGDDATVWEAGPLQSLAAEGHLGAYFHTGFWHPLDTLRDKTILEGLWAGGAAPWRIW